MDIKAVLEELDRRYETDRESVESFLTGKIEEADREGDRESLVTLLNEGIGFFRDRSRFAECRVCCARAVMALQELEMEGTLPYATTLLNVATADRAFNRLTEADQIYEEVLKIYEKRLAPSDYLYAALYNNIALLRQKQNRPDEARDLLAKALEIIREYPEAQIELATTLINAASVLLKTENWKNAHIFIMEALGIFLPDKTDMFHYSMALGVLAEYLYKLREYDEAEVILITAMESLEKKMGKTADYKLLENNLRKLRKVKKGLVNG